MKKITLFLFASFLALNTISQDITVLDENFKNNSKAWQIIDHETFDTKVSDGRYKINNHATFSQEVYHLVEEFSKEDNFVIEAKIRQVAGKKNKFYGLVFSADEEEANEISFTLTSKGTFSILKYVDNESSVIAELAKGYNINSFNNFNTFRVEKVANSVFFYLNDQLLATSEADDYYYPSIGFYLDEKVGIEVSQVKITKSPRFIDIVDGADTIADKVKLSNKINSEYDELLPVVTADGKTLYVIRNNHPDNMGPANDDQDIWYSTLDEEGEWTELKNIGKPLNNKDYNFVVSASPDNNSLVVGNIYGPDGKTLDQGLSIAYKTKDSKGWEVPIGIDIKDYYNDHDFVSFFLCNDNRTLILGIQRDNSIGERDLYVSFLNEDDSWTEPLHMGNVINTVRDEGNPFVAADNKTMYFASKGHPGYGGYDIFVTKRLDDSWTNWSEPKNLGPKINTGGNDLNYFLDAKGETAYIASKGDIYVIQNVEKIGATTLVSGIVYNQNTKEPIGAVIKYYDLSTNKELGKASSDPVTGEYKIVLPAEKHYSFVAEQKDFFPISESIDLRGLGEYSEYEKDLFLSPIERGKVIRLNNIFFSFDKTDLLSESYNELDRLYNILRAHPKLTIEIGGHTDDKGSVSYNQKLSENRAQAVVDYLIEVKKIRKNRLTAVGYGKLKPLVPNDTDENRAYNRRVEFKIIDR